MNKIALKKFAIEARNDLRDKVKTKAFQYGITEESIDNKKTVPSSDFYKDGKNALTRDDKDQRDKVISLMESKGFNQVIEEVAYTWFNRFTALRFMEIHNYLPSKVRVLSSINEGSVEPDIIREALNVDLDVDKEIIYKLKMSTENDAADRLYKYLILAQCDALSVTLPFLFGKTHDYTKLLFPDGLMAEGSFVRKMTDTEELPESNWEQVEIIGWLYQYYIAEENERVIKAKKRYKKEEIPFATQLFTPDWIVRYMVQNALGRYWVESHPEDRDLLKNWEFYLENPNPEPDFEEKLAPYLNKNMKVEEINCFDPAMGSGHILVYMFDVLYDIYSKCGYMEREIPKLIIENNLYGLDIDDRAYQLACFCVIMKAQQYNNRFLRNLERQVRETGEYIKLNLASIQETNGFDAADIEYIAGEAKGEKFEKVKRFVEQFENAKIYGSLTEVSEFDEELLSARAREIIKYPVEDVTYPNDKKMKVDAVLENLILQARILRTMVDILVTNPPYMGSRYMNPILSDYLKQKSSSSMDLFSSFIEYSRSRVNVNGQLGFITPFVWMFLSSYEDLRRSIIKNNNITSLVELEYNSFEVAVVPVCTFTIRNYLVDLAGEYVKLSDFPGIEIQSHLTIEAVSNPHTKYRYQRKNSDFMCLPGYPLGYWISKSLFGVFQQEKRLIEFIDATGSQNITADNNRFLRFLWEVDMTKINKGWALYTKGGKYRKWYGNLEYVIDWTESSIEFYRTNKTSNLLNKRYWFREGITYNGISNRGFSVRYADNTIYDKKGPTFHVNKSNLFKYIMGILNSKPIDMIMNVLNPTMSYQKRDVDNLPLILASKEKFDEVVKLTEENIQISKHDWDLEEISLDYIISEIILNRKIGNSLQKIVEKSLNDRQERFLKLKHNEEKINEIAINLYGLIDEIDSNVNEDDITISLMDEVELVKNFISYAIGCMFGRYSLDEEGLIFAGGQFDLSRYKTFPADKDNVLPIVSDPYFNDDIVTRFIEFLEITFSKETLEENLRFIAETLGKKAGETDKETIRRYFLNDFYKDHVQTYKKRPIYWMITSGKNKAFNALIYMHRYDKTTLSRVRTDYLHVLQTRLNAQREKLLSIINGNESEKEKSKAKKGLKTIEKQIEELKDFDEVLHHMADMQIEIELDDGVAVNYLKFKELLVDIKLKDSEEE